MPLTSAQTKAALEKEQEATSNPSKFHIHLLFEGVKVKPVEIFEALDAKFGTVFSQKDTTKHQDYTFKVTP